MTALRIVAGLALALAACSLDGNALQGERCNDTVDDCVVGTECYRGFCVESATCIEGQDAGTCFDHPDQELINVGACRQGRLECDGNTITTCLDQVTPVIETCNGIDDDCNGADDDVAPDCNTGRPGRCKAGTQECNENTLRCVPNAEAIEETCNGEDDDCDGETDEGTDVDCYPFDTGCEDDEPCVGTCLRGVQVCMGGELQACSGAKGPDEEDNCTETGLAVDDDCDTDVDEDCNCDLGEMQECWSGPSDAEFELPAPCDKGEQTCGENLKFGPCLGEMLPQTESCPANGADDDCNGVVEDIAMLGEGCIDDGEMGVCREGTYACNGDDLVCDTPEMMTEACNGEDDDCNGQTDETFDLATDEDHCGMCGTDCNPGDDCCSSACVTLETDEDHCGACGDPCTGGLSCCESGCFDTSVSEDHCGDCGNECDTGETCCGGDCFDLMDDDDHCGACAGPSVECQNGQDCTNGHCCPTGQTWCIPANKCIDTDVDKAHCGACNDSCTGGVACTCNDGVCGGVLCS